MDEKKIEEVMRLVCEYGIACLDMDNDDYELSCHRTLIESKLRELAKIPAGCVIVNAGALQMVVNALRRDAMEGKAIRGEMVNELLATAYTSSKEPS